MVNFEIFLFFWGNFPAKNHFDFKLIQKLDSNEKGNLLKMKSSTELTQRKQRDISHASILTIPLIKIMSEKLCTLLIPMR